MTVCNMTIEGGGRAGMIAPDETTFEWFTRPGQRPGAPKGVELDAAIEGWRELRSDEGAELRHGGHRSTPPRSRRRSPGAPTRGWCARSPSGCPRPRSSTAPPTARRPSARCTTWRSSPGTPIEEIAIDRVFIGSCTNSRIGDLRAAAEVVAGRKVAPRVSAMVVPGSQQVKAQAEAEGLDRVFRDAGFDWRVAGCSMCLGMNPDILAPGERCASTSNRNFEGRQGRGGRTHLVSPQMAAAAAIEGHFVDIREWR